MTALITLLAGLALMLACSMWATRSDDAATRVTLIVMLGISATAFNVVVPIPNIEATTTAVLCAGLVLGARTGAGVDELMELVEAELPQFDRRVHVLVPYAQAALSARVHAEGEVLKTEYRDEGVELLVRRVAAGIRLVDRDHADQQSLGVAQRHEQGVLGGPGVRLLAGGDGWHVALHAEAVPVELAAGHEVGAAAPEALVEQRHPGLARRTLAHQLRNRLLRSHRGRGEHVVEGRPVDVHDHGPVTEQVGDRAAHVLKDVL